MFTKFPPTPASYTLSLHDALPILTTWKKVSPTRKRWRARHTLSGSEPPEGTRDQRRRSRVMELERARAMPELANEDSRGDRKSTRLNSSHQIISYAVFCLKKKKKQ